MIKKLTPLLTAFKSNNKITKVNLFFLFFGFWAISLLIALLSTTKYGSFVAINHFRSYPADLIFTFLTILGNGVILIPLAGLFIWKKNYEVLIGVLLAILLNTLFVSILKHAFDLPRPLASYGEHIVRTAHWIKLHTKYAFPSGHTALAFCLGSYLSLSFYRYRNITVLCFFSAALVGYSRIYLGQHFLRDVWLGSLLGVLIAIFTFRLVQYTATKLAMKRNRDANQ
jgi:membrane-associated phospholipid phosphatase